MRGRFAAPDLQNAAGLDALDRQLLAHLHTNLKRIKLAAARSDELAARPRTTYGGPPGTALTCAELVGLLRRPEGAL